MKTKNLSVGILAAVLTLALWYNFVLKPMRSQTSKVKADVAVQKQKLVPLQAQLDQASIDQAHAATFKAQLASLEAALPNSPALAAFIRDANAIAVASRVSWQSVTHATPVPGLGGPSTITVGIQIKGTYPQIMDYLGRLAVLKRLLVVDTVQFSAAAGPGAGPGGAATGAGLSTGPFSGASQLTLTISARMFLVPPPVANTAVTGTPTTVPA